MSSTQTVTHQTSAIEPPVCGPPTRFERGSLRRVGGVRVLNVAGSFYEMGRQHGALLKDEIGRGPIPYYRRFVQRLFGAGQLGALGPLAVDALQHTVGARVARKMPAFATDTIRGLADGAEMPYASLLEGCTMPDTLLWLAARMMQIKGPGPAAAHRISLGLGCTSALAWGDATRDGKMYHARNLDYHGVGCWPSTQTVIIHEPEGGQRYLSVAAAGVALGGVTAMNEAGLSLTVHQHMFTDRARLGGVPIGTVGDEVMREARTLDEAEKILRAHQPIGCWTYLVADGNAKDVLAFEQNPDRMVAIRSKQDEDTFGYANIYLDRELGDTEVDLYGSYWRHNHGRHVRANALLRERHGDLDAAGMAAIIGHTGDARCRVKDSIAMVLTVGSVVFRPEDGAAWVGDGEAPTSHGTFLPFDLRAGGYAPELGAFDGAREREPAALRAFEQFRVAYVAYTDDGDLTRARAALALACELQPREALYHAALGLLSLNDGDTHAAHQKLGEAIALGHPDEERVAAMHLWRGRALDVLGRRHDATRDYRRVLSLKADPPVRAAALRDLKKPYAAKRAKKVHVDLALVDVVSP
jgi:tetratricopeptide (TPR) repeat protein